LQTLAATSQSPFASAASVHHLSHADCVELVKSGTCQQFLFRFAQEFIPTAYACVPVRLDSETDLIEMMTRLSENTLVTYVPTSRSVSGLSCCVSLPLLTQPWHGSVYFHVQYFGDKLDDALEHIRAQLHHVAEAHRGRCVLFRFCFSSCISSTTAAQEISSNVLPGLEVLLSERTYLVSVNVEHYMYMNLRRCTEPVA